MATLTIDQLRDQLQDLRRSGAEDAQVAAAWRETAQALADPSPETDSAHHQVNAIAFELGLAALTGPWWRPPTTLGRYHPDGPETRGIPWDEAYYRGYAMVVHVDGQAGAWVFRAYSCDPHDQQAFRQERGGFATLAEAYEAAMRSQISAIDHKLG